jgi:hypothetical protein
MALVYDPKTIGQVAANTAAQKLIEDKHNERLDTISAKQKKILQYTATMEGIKELYHLTMTNVRGFGEETAYYKEIFQLSADILTSVPTVTKYILEPREELCPLPERTLGCRHRNRGSYP